jgi:uncharacterized phage protein gp47/JayE
MAAPLPTREDFFNVGARELLARQRSRPVGMRVTQQAIYTTGTNVNSALAGAAAMADEVMRHTAIRFNELFLDSADDAALARLVADHIDADLQQKQPVRSVVPLIFSRSIPPSAGAVQSIPIDSIVRTNSGIEFRLTSDANFALNAVGPIVVEAEAMLAGSAGNVDSGTIVRFAAQPADTGIVVTNSENAAGGADLETSRDYLARAKSERKARRRGILGAIQLGAASVAGVKSAVVEEALDSSGDPSGLVRVYIADASGRANSSLTQLVRDQLVEFRGCGIVPQVIGASPNMPTISYLLPILAGYDATAVTAQLRTLTVAMVNQLQPGEALRRSMLLAIARTVPGVVVSDSAVTLPATDLVPLPNETIKARADLVLVNGA